MKLSLFRRTILKLDPGNAHTMTLNVSRCFDLSLTGEYDEFDAYNAGLKWRVYTEEATPLAKKK